MEALNMKQKKANKLRSPYSLTAFKYGCSLEITSRALEEKNTTTTTWAFVIFQKIPR